MIWEASTSEHVSRRSYVRLWQLAARLSNSSSPEAVSFTLLVPADDSQPIVLRELSKGATVSAQARQLFDGLWEVVRARGLHQLAPELWAVMLVDEAHMEE